MIHGSRSAPSRRTLTRLMRRNPDDPGDAARASGAPEPAACGAGREPRCGSGGRARAEAGLAGALQGTAPTAGALYTDGPDGRYLLGGRGCSGSTPAIGRRERGVPAAGLLAGVVWRHASRAPGTPPTRARPACRAASVGTARTSSSRTRARALAWIVRFESVNFRPGVAERQAARYPHRCLPAVRVPAREPQPHRGQPAGDPRRQPPQSSLTAPVVGRNRRRMVELRRPAGRGLPAPGRPRRLPPGRRATDASLSVLPRRHPRAGDGAQLQLRPADRPCHGGLRAAQARPRDADVAAAAPRLSSARRARSPVRGSGRPAIPTCTPRGWRDGGVLARGRASPRPDARRRLHRAQRGALGRA